jgi:3-dehydrosphinganine reductase
VVINFLGGIMSFYNGKFALVTGGSSGIGYAIAAEILKEGGSVAILARRKELLTEAESSLKLFITHPTQKLVLVQADVTDRKQLDKSLTDMVITHGTPDLVFNSAGVAHPGTFTTLKPEIFDWMMNVNYFGTVNVLKSIVPNMQKKRTGTIVNISSIAGFIGVYGYTAYGASKFAVSGFSDALRAELKPYGISVSVVFPPDTKTPQLEYEEQFKPFITKQIAGSTNLMSAESVAKEILKKVAGKKYLILPGSEGKILYFAHNLLGGVLYPVMDWMVNSAIGKIKFG